MEKQCPVCKSGLRNLSVGPHSKTYDCLKCGQFTLTGTAAELVPLHLGGDLEKRAAFSHALRKMQRHNQQLVVTWELAESLITNADLPSPFDQADNLILWLGETTRVAGERVQIQPALHQAIVGAGSDEGMAFVLKYLFDSGLLEGELALTSGFLGCAEATLSFSGWERYYELEKGRKVSRKAFMAMQYGDADLDKIVRDVFAPAIKRAGFDLARLDDTPSAGLIDDRLRVEILTSRFLIADLTHENRGAYWEAGFAEGLRKPVIYTCRKQEFDAGKSHFDTNHHLTVVWDPADLPAAAGALVATVRATLPNEARLTDD